MTESFVVQRQRLIASLRDAGIYDVGVLHAMASVPRELFVPEALRGMAYADRALPLSLGQTISQPLMVALMTQALRLTGRERVLEVGTGSGYQAAILGCLAASVYTIERHVEFIAPVANRLEALGISNVTLLVGDGSLGWPEGAPYDRVLVTAGAPFIPSPLVHQLIANGLLVIPVGRANLQELQVVRRGMDAISIQSLGACTFVPLVGENGWQMDSGKERS
jgi:protein-L-isoaspartate(D-aspartate) O-methyltransferase